MRSDTSPRTFHAQRVDPDLEVRSDIGTLTCDAQGRLAVASARSPFEHYLADIVAAANAQDVLNIKVPPPAPLPPRSICVLSVPRTAPDIVDRLKDYLSQKFDLLLVDTAASGHAD